MESPDMQHHVDWLNLIPYHSRTRASAEILFCIDTSHVIYYKLGLGLST